jgi:hypothetical protein
MTWPTLRRRPGHSVSEHYRATGTSMSDFYYRLVASDSKLPYCPLRALSERRMPDIDSHNLVHSASVPMSGNATIYARFRIAAWITVTNVTVACGFALAGLVHPEAVAAGATIADNAARVFAMYAAARTFPLALAVLASVWRRALGATVVLGGLAGVIQFADALVGMVCHDPGKTLGPLAIAAVQLWATIRLGLACRSPRSWLAS